MIDTLLGILAPHHCYGCDRIGTLLCVNCNYDIIMEPYDGCLACGRPAGMNGRCKRCRLPYQRAWCAAERSGVIERVINAYKFSRVKAAHVPLADLLHTVIGELPPDTRIVPIPTIPHHIRQRGYDHIKLIARRLARRRGLGVAPLLSRQTVSVQHEVGRAARLTQARQAFHVIGELDPAVPYLLVDDVVTTGATLRYAAEALHRAGAREIWVAAIARQPLD